MKFLTSSWMVMLLGGLLYLGTTAFVLLGNKQSIRPAMISVDGTNRPVANVRGPSWEFFNPDLDEMVVELRDRTARLDERQRQLDEYAARLQAEKDEITQVTRNVERIQRDLDNNVVRIREEEQANLKKQAKTYALMEPAAAAAIIRGLDDVSIVKVLVFMKEAEAAPILNVLARMSEADAKRMALVSERLRLTQSRNPAAVPQNP